MAGGIITLNPTPGIWTQLPANAATQGIFQKGEFDLAQSGTPAGTFFHVSANDPPFVISTGHMANTNEFWVRSNGSVALLWTS